MIEFIVKCYAKYRGVCTSSSQIIIQLQLIEHSPVEASQRQVLPTKVAISGQGCQTLSHHIPAYMTDAHKLISVHACCALLKYNHFLSAPTM